MIAARDPAAGFHTKHTQVNRITLRWNNAILANYAILFTSGNDFAGE